MVQSQSFLCLKTYCLGTLLIDRDFCVSKIFDEIKLISPERLCLKHSSCLCGRLSKTTVSVFEPKQLPVCVELYERFRFFLLTF